MMVLWEITAGEKWGRKEGIFSLSGKFQACVARERKKPVALSEDKLLLHARTFPLPESGCPFCSDLSSNPSLSSSSRAI